MFFKTKSVNDRLNLTWQYMGKSFIEFKKNDPLRLASSTAFFSTFALPPIIIIIIQLLGVFLNKRAFGSNIMQKLTSALGETSALQIRSILRNVYSLSDTWYITTFGFIFLLFVATTLFVVIKNSINQIWKIGLKDHPGFFFHLGQRARSLGIIALAGFLLFCAFLLEGIRVFLDQYISDYTPKAGNFINELIFLLITTIWFSILFRFIADGRPRWKASLTGSIFTAILFTFGKIILKVLLTNSNLGAIYGTSGAILLIMLFIFYSSFIFYYGACFIYIMSEEIGEPIKPVSKAYKYRLEEIRTDD